MHWPSQITVQTAHFRQVAACVKIVSTSVTWQWVKHHFM